MRKIYPVLIEKYDVITDLFWLLNVFDFQDEAHSNLQRYYQSTFCSPHAWGLAFVTASYKELGKLTQIVLMYHGAISSEIIVGQASTSPGISGQIIQKSMCLSLLVKGLLGKWPYESQVGPSKTVWAEEDEHRVTRAQFA